MCTNPHFVSSIGFWVPCGQCMSCRIARAREWTERMVHELEYWDHAVFVTLTVQNATQAYSLQPKLLTDFLKLLRYYIAPARMSYYACGEYGGKDGRAHYHAIIYGVELCGSCEQCNRAARRARRLPELGTDCDGIRKAWRHGFVDARGVGPESIGYVAKYITKFDSRDLGDRLAPFSRMSKGLGKRWLLDRKEQVWKEKAVRKDGNLIALPRYYVQMMNRFFRPKPSVKHKPIELLQFDSCKWDLASWVLARHRWRMMRDMRTEKELRIGKKMKRNSTYFDFLNLSDAELRQAERNVRSAVIIKESKNAFVRDT